jgi:hypothetical protein
MERPLRDARPPAPPAPQPRRVPVREASPAAMTERPCRRPTRQTAPSRRGRNEPNESSCHLKLLSTAHSKCSSIAARNGLDCRHDRFTRINTGDFASQRIRATRAHGETAARSLVGLTFQRPSRMSGTIAAEGSQRGQRSRKPPARNKFGGSGKWGALLSESRSRRRRRMRIRR